MVDRQGSEESEDPCQNPHIGSLRYDIFRTSIVAKRSVKGDKMQNGKNTRVTASFSYLNSSLFCCKAKLKAKKDKLGNRVTL